MKKKILLNQKIVKENVQYVWVAESCACDVCQEMDGKIYDSANDIPDRPHPNCKCHIEIIEKESDEPITDPMKVIQENKKNKTRLLSEIKELMGRTKSLDEELDEYLKQVKIQESKFKELIQVIDIQKLEPEDSQKLAKAIEDIDFAKYRGEKAKGELMNLQVEIDVLEGGVEVTKIIYFVVAVFEATLEILIGTFAGILKTIADLVVALIKMTPQLEKEFLRKIAFIYATKDPNGKNVFDKAANIKVQAEEDAKNFYNISSGYADGGKKYIEDNGLIVHSINDIKNYKLQKDISAKVEQQYGTKDCMGVVLNQNSSLAKNIVNTDEFKALVHKYKDKLNAKIVIDNSSLNIESDNNMRHALHKTDILYLKKEPDGSLSCYQLDTYDFNKGEQDLTIKIPREFQEQGRMKKFFSLTIIRVEEALWQKF